MTHSANSASMKTLIAIIVPLMTLAANAADVRLVGTTRIDLAPLHEWLGTKTGERPMKHWKHIQISVLIPNVPWPVCSISADGGSTKSVYLKNIPAVAVNAFIEEERLTKAVADKADWIADETKRLRAVGAHESEWEYGSPNYIRHQQDLAAIENQREAFKELKSQLQSALKNEKAVGSDFAMFTGQIYNKMEVWDCGQKTQ